jgi:uncharacterized UPF0160 family protein
MSGTLFVGDFTLDRTAVVRFGTLRFWAERGLVHVEDARDNSYKTFSARSGLERLRALNDMLKNSNREAHTHDQFDRANVERVMRMVEDMLEVCRRAQTQGEPFDESARRDAALRAPRTVVVPAYGGGL